MLLTDSHTNINKTPAWESSFDLFGLAREISSFPAIIWHENSALRGCEIFCTTGTLARRGANGRPRVAIVRALR